MTAAGSDSVALLWARLSVFPGGFDLEAAERVCAGEPLTVGSLFDTLGRLVEKSIVLCEQDGRRYRMLDTIREYGAEHLALLGEQDELRCRRRDYYLGLAKQAATGSLGLGQVGWLVRLRQETHNLRVALDHSYTSPGQEATGLRMTVLLAIARAVHRGSALARPGAGRRLRLAGGGLGRVRGGCPARERKLGFTSRTQLAAWVSR